MLYDMGIEMYKFIKGCINLKFGERERDVCKLFFIYMYVD